MHAGPRSDRTARGHAAFARWCSRPVWCCLLRSQLRSYSARLRCPPPMASRDRLTLQGRTPVFPICAATWLALLAVGVGVSSSSPVGTVGTACGTRNTSIPFVAQGDEMPATSTDQVMGRSLLRQVVSGRVRLFAAVRALFASQRQAHAAGYREHHTTVEATLSHFPRRLGSTTVMAVTIIGHCGQRQG
jgi:hypothetical protein